MSIEKCQLVFGEEIIEFKICNCIPTNARLYSGRGYEWVQKALMKHYWKIG